MPRSRKIVFALVSLLGAILVWLYVVTVIAPEATTRVSSIPINIDGTIVLEERGLIITSQDAESLSLELSASRVNLSKLNADSIRVNADASKIREPGEYALTCTVTFPDTVRSSDVDILRKSVDTVNITVTRIEQKTLPVQLNWTGSVKEGFLLEAESVQMDPAEITLTGPEAEVSQIAKAVVTLDVSDLEETVVETLPVEFLNAANEPVEFSEATTVSATQVGMTLPVLRTKELRLTVNTLEGGGVTNENVTITLDVESIRVKGAAEVIDALEDSFIIGTVDLATLEDKQELSFNLSLPAGVTNMSGETEVKALIQVNGVQSDTISVTDIRMINTPEGYHTELSTRTARVRVRGSTEEIREIKANNDNGIYILVDLADYYQTGAFTVPGKVINSSHPAVSTTDTVEIDVVISNNETNEQNSSED